MTFYVDLSSLEYRYVDRSADAIFKCQKGMFWDGTKNESFIILEQRPPLLRI